MKILAIESSSLVASAAIVNDDILVAEYTVNHKVTHSQTLLPMIDEILTMTQTDKRSIDAIADVYKRQVEEIDDLQEDEIRDFPSIATNHDTVYFVKVANKAGRLILIIDIHNLLTADEAEDAKQLMEEK